MFSSARIFFSIARFFVGTLFCRCTGFFREQIMSACFGSTPSVAAFLMARQYASAARNCFGETALRTTFIPQFEQIRGKSERDSLHFFFQMMLFCFLFTTFLSLLVIGLLFTCLSLFSLSEATREVVILTMILFPSQIFSSLYSLNSAFLHCQNQFFLSSVTPAIVNMIWIVSALLFRNYFIVRAMQYLSAVLLFASLLEWLLTCISIRKTVHQFDKGEKSKFRFSSFWQQWRLFLGKWGLVMIGVGATNINIIFDKLFARKAELSGPSYLHYALRLQQAPLSLLAIAFSTVLFPNLAKAFATKEWQQGRQLLIMTLNRCLSLVIPCTAACFVLGLISVQIVYERGAFTSFSTNYTTLCLWGYALALIPQSLSLLLLPVYYASHHYLLPVVTTLIALAINLLCNAFFVYSCHWGAVSITLATSISSWISVAILIYGLKNRVGAFFSPALFQSCFKMLLSSLFALVAAMFLNYFLHSDQSISLLLFQERSPLSSSLFWKLFVLLRSSAYFVLFLGCFATLFRDKETLFLFTFWRRLLKRFIFFQ